MKPVLELAQALIRIRSFTPIRPELLLDAQLSLDCLEEFANEHIGISTLRLPFEGKAGDAAPYKVDNLYLEVKSGNPGKQLCFIGHTDVVPVGDVSAWQEDPFGGVVKNGYLYGRGATDMKGAVAAFFAAAARVVAQGGNFNIAAIITTDEEWYAHNGTQKVLGWMSQNGKNPAAFLVGEPSSPDDLGTHLKTGRRGSLNGKLKFKGTQGHAAYAHLFSNPVEALSFAIAVLKSELTFADGTPPTTFTPTSFASNGGSTAIIPATGEVGWNLRFHKGVEPHKVVEDMRFILANPPVWARNYADVLNQVEITANMPGIAWPYQSPVGGLAQMVEDAVYRTLGRMPVEDNAGGTTDGRFVQEYFPHAEVVEFGPPEKGGRIKGKASVRHGYGRKGGMHQVDERIAVEDLTNLEEIYFRILQTYFAS